MVQMSSNQPEVRVCTAGLKARLVLRFTRRLTGVSLQRRYV